MLYDQVSWHNQILVVSLQPLMVREIQLLTNNNDQALVDYLMAISLNKCSL